MKKQKDAYGAEVWAYLQGKKSLEIVERDDGYTDFSGGAKNYFFEYKNWAPHEKKAVQYAKGKVLDVGAGAGRVSLYLQSKGLDVTAIDNSPLAIKVCKKRGVKKALVRPIEEINKFRPGTFDTIAMFGNNFGLFRSKTKAKQLLKAFYKITSPKAQIIAEANDTYKTKNPVHLRYHKLNRKRGRMPGQLRIRIRFENYIGNWFDYLLVSEKEMKQLLKGTGWKVKKIIHSKRSTYFAIIGKEGKGA